MPLSLRSPRLRTRDDAALVAAFRAGDEAAFVAIHDRHRPALERYARRMLASAGDAASEDVVQEAFVRAHRALRADARPMALRAWLYRIAHNRALDELDRLRARPAVALLDDDGGGATGTAVDPLDEAVRREHLRHVLADVQGLPATQRSALVIRELGGLSYAEIAEALDVTVPAVKSLLVRARMHLADAAVERAAAEERDRERALAARPAPARRLVPA